MSKQKTVKQIRSLCLALLLLLVLAACGGKADEPSTTSKVDIEENEVKAPEPTPEPEPEPPIPYTDVPEDAAYYDAVVWAYENGIVSDGDKFDPDTSCTRGQVITFLWRAMGSPEPQTEENPFSDVSSSDWYYAPALWAYENEIVTSTTFNAGNSCTNAETLTFLWRAEGKPAASVYNSTAALAASGEYYARPVAWADNNGLFDGADSTFGPAAPCLRSDIVTYLYWAVEQWTFTEEDKNVQAEYEQIINDAQLYEVHGSGLIYADYVDVDGDGKVELLAVDVGENLVEDNSGHAYDITAAVYANINGHAEKSCEQTFSWIWHFHELSICKNDGDVYLRHTLTATSTSSVTDTFYKITDGAFVVSETAEVSYASDESERFGITEEEYNLIVQKYTSQTELFGYGFTSGISVHDRGLLLSPAEYKAAIAKAKGEYWETNRNQIYADVLNGDFSYFAGNYVSESSVGRPEEAALDKNGTLSELYSDIAPISITITDNGVIHCLCQEPVYWEPEDVDGDGDSDLGGFYLEHYYDIYPVGVRDEYIENREQLMNYHDDADKIRIHHFWVDGGVLDVMYSKES